MRLLRTHELLPLLLRLQHLISPLLQISQRFQRILLPHQKVALQLRWRELVRRQLVGECSCHLLERLGVRDLRDGARLLVRQTAARGLLLGRLAVHAHKCFVGLASCGEREGDLEVYASRPDQGSIEVFWRVGCHDEYVALSYIRKCTRTACKSAYLVRSSAIDHVEQGAQTD